MNTKTETPHFLTRSFHVSRQDVLNSRDPHRLTEELRDLELACRRDLGMKLMEHLDLDQAMTVRLRRHSRDDPMRRVFSVTLDLELMAVHTMRVEMREFVPRPVEYREPKPQQKPAVPSLWQRYCNYVDSVREGLGG
jgi:hypothetical protein